MHKPNKNIRSSQSWLKLRYEVLKASKGRCQLCGASPEESGASLQVDHIKPISKHPELAFEKTNLQVLCKPCNWGKLDRHEDDWR